MGLFHNPPKIARSGTGEADVHVETNEAVATEEIEHFLNDLLGATGAGVYAGTKEGDDRLKTMPMYEAMFFSESLRKPLRIRISEKFG